MHSVSFESVETEFEIKNESDSSNQSEQQIQSRENDEFFQNKTAKLGEFIENSQNILQLCT